jgi:hypothetical protein
MATVHIAIGYSQGRGVGGVQLPVRKGAGVRSEQLTSSATSLQSTLVATQTEVSNGAMWFVTTSGGAIDIQTGLNPTAVNTASHRLLDGGTIELAITAVGELAAIKDA